VLTLFHVIPQVERFRKSALSLATQNGGDATTIAQHTAKTLDTLMTMDQGTSADAGDPRSAANKVSLRKGGHVSCDRAALP